MLSVIIIITTSHYLLPVLSIVFGGNGGEVSVLSEEM